MLHKNYVGTVFELQKLFSFKQILLGDTRQKEGIKWHMVTHMAQDINHLGPTQVFDMVKKERSHQKIKLIFEGTSKRFGTTFEEIISKVIVHDTISNAWEKLKETLPAVERGRRIPQLQKMYTTADNITYECPSGASYRKKVSYRLRQGMFGFRGNEKVLNPIMSDVFFHNVLVNYIRFVKDEGEEVEGT